MHLGILSSVLLIEMFDISGKALKCRKELFLKRYKKSSPSCMRLQDMCGQI